MSKDYDTKSIMGYGSFAHSREGSNDDLEKYVLMEWKTPYEKIEDVPKKATFDNAKRMWPYKDPSSLDLQAIKELYPV
jgi:hypothetical protein